MGLFFYKKIGSIISIVDLPTTNIIEPFFQYLIVCVFAFNDFLPSLLFFDNFVGDQLTVTNLFIVFIIINNLENSFKGNTTKL
ncbi:hypothetical protein AZJ63_02480 [Streptococcus pneumoniae]|nr:hypothetical protein AZJ63_02480 [Streptococcus pneumoniae]